MAKPVNYDADQAAEDRSKGTIKVGGRKLRARKKSGKLMKDLIGLGPDVQPKEGEEVSKQQSQENIDLVYKQLAMLIVYAEDAPEGSEDSYRADENPNDEWLLEELDFDDANELVTKLMPSKEERDAGKPARSG